MTELRRHLADLATLREQEARRGRPEAGRALEPDQTTRRHRPGPCCERPMPGRVVRERRLRQGQPELVDDARRERRLVGIDPDRAHRVSSSLAIRWARARRAAVR